MSVDTARAAAERFAKVFAGAEVEKLAVAFLGSEGQIIDLHVRDGSLHAEIDLPIRDIMAEALTLGAAGLILAHNHPSGDPTPSREDIHATRMLAAAGRGLGIRLVDHLIFAGGGCSSFVGLGLL